MGVRCPPLELMSERLIEPGLSLNEDTGQYRTHWPPAGRFAELWKRFEAAGFTDDERCDLVSLLNQDIYDKSTLAAYTDDEGNWIDIDWSDVFGEDA